MFSNKSLYGLTMALLLICIISTYIYIYLSFFLLLSGNPNKFFSGINLIYLSVCFSAYLSIYLSAYLSIYMPSYISIYIFLEDYLRWRKTPWFPNEWEIFQELSFAQGIFHSIYIFFCWEGGWRNFLNIQHGFSCIFCPSSIPIFCNLTKYVNGWVSLYHFYVILLIYCFLFLWM